MNVQHASSTKHKPTASGGLPHPGRWGKGWDNVVVPASDAEAAKLLNACRVRLDVMVAAVAKHKSAGKFREAQKLTRSVLRSQSAVLGSLASLPKKYRPDCGPLMLVHIGLQMSMFEHSGDAHRVQLIPKEEGDTMRMVIMSSFREYARQRLALRLAAVLFTPSPTQFILQGGMPAVVKWLETNLTNYPFVITTDVPNCFFSLSRERVEAGVPLPGSVMKSVLFDVFAHLKMPHSRYGDGSHYYGQLHHDNEHGVHQGWGIPPGTALSCLSAEVIIHNLLRAVEQAVDGVLAASYGDNIIILAPSKAARDACISSLLKAASLEFPPKVVDELRARVVSGPPKKGVKFLGSVFTVRKGTVNRRVTETRIMLFGVRLAMDMLEKGTLTREKVLSRIDAWEEAHDFDKRVHRMAKQLRKELAPPPKKPKKAKIITKGS